jgi:hypothetical protein
MLEELYAEDAGFFTMKMGDADSSETLVPLSETIRRHGPKDDKVNVTMNSGFCLRIFNCYMLDL